jgi:hypothetical protein
VKTTFASLKKQEARRRMAALKQLREGTRSAEELQREASLVGDGAKWKITNFSQVLAAMGKWSRTR